MANICVTYFDNTNVDFDAYKESLQQSRAEWDEETTDVTEEEIWDYISECEQAAWEDFLSGLNMSKYSNALYSVRYAVGTALSKLTQHPAAT